MGKNITTQGLDLFGLPVRMILLLGIRAVIWITGLRKPCKQLNGYQQALTKALGM
ncbi:hypothetical protein [Kiloniella spongiae]|uniref:hypothetical protein n=1 Tax=Kiloniella spongiae TaxID=1489064 RepID=UPI00387E0FF2